MFVLFSAWLLWWFPRCYVSYPFPWCFRMFPLVFLRFPRVFLLFPLSVPPCPILDFTIIFYLRMAKWLNHLMNTWMLLKILIFLNVKQKTYFYENLNNHSIINAIFQKPFNCHYYIAMLSKYIKFIFLTLLIEI